MFVYNNKKLLDTKLEDTNIKVEELLDCFGLVDFYNRNTKPIDRINQYFLNDEDGKHFYELLDIIVTADTSKKQLFNRSLELIRSKSNSNLRNKLFSSPEAFDSISRVFVLDQNENFRRIELVSELFLESLKTSKESDIQQFVNTANASTHFYFRIISSLSVKPVFYLAERIIKVQAKACKFLFVEPLLKEFIYIKDLPEYAGYKEVYDNKMSVSNNCSYVPYVFRLLAISYDKISDNEMKNRIEKEICTMLSYDLPGLNVINYKEIIDLVRKFLNNSSSHKIDGLLQLFEVQIAAGFIDIDLYDPMQDTLNIFYLSIIPKSEFGLSSFVNVLRFISVNDNGRKKLTIPMTIAFIEMAKEMLKTEYKNECAKMLREYVDSIYINYSDSQITLYYRTLLKKIEGIINSLTEDDSNNDQIFLCSNS